MWLVVTDTPGIKDYVFGTDILREIQGASALLDEFNRHGIEQILRAHGAGAVETVFANGGSGQFVLTGAASAKEVEDACLAVARALSTQSCGLASLNFGYASMEGRSYREAVSLAHARMRHRRWSSPQVRTVTTSPLLRECGSLSSLPASAYTNSSGAVVSEGDPKGAWVSDATQAKLLAAVASRQNSDSLWGQFEALVGRKPWTTLEEAGSGAQRPGYIGVVYADGNSMGAVARQLPDQGTCRAFSRIVDASARSATFEVLRANNFNALPLLIGGDDVVMVMPAGDALRFASLLPPAFRARSREMMAEGQPPAGEPTWLQRQRPSGFSLSVGVAIGRHRMPFHLMLDLAEQLLKSAKGAAVDSPEDDKSRVDFHVTTTSSVRDLAELRGHDLSLRGPEGEAFSRTHRPYRPGELSDLLDVVERLRREGIPRSKVADLMEATYAPTVRAAQLRAIETLGRMQRRHRSILEGALAKFGCPGLPPFGEGNLTILLDLAECFQITGRPPRRA